jgi:hypothetical protein
MVEVLGRLHPFRPHLALMEPLPLVVPPEQRPHPMMNSN